MPRLPAAVVVLVPQVAPQHPPGRQSLGWDHARVRRQLAAHDHGAVGVHELGPHVGQRQEGGEAPVDRRGRERVRRLLAAVAGLVARGVEQRELEPGAARGPVAHEGGRVVAAVRRLRGSGGGGGGVGGVGGVDVEGEVLLLVAPRIAKNVPRVPADREGVGVELGVEGRVEDVVDDELEREFFFFFF